MLLRQTTSIGWKTGIFVAIFGVGFVCLARACAAEGAATRVILTGERGQVSIIAPADCRIRVDRLKLPRGRTQKRIVICRTGKRGELEIAIKLKLLKVKPGE